MRFFLAAKRTFCVITLYALEIRALFFIATFVANFDAFRCVACRRRVYSCREIIKKRGGSIFLSEGVANQPDDFLQEFELQITNQDVIQT